MASANSTKRRVVVTGMGGITPMGNSIETIWNNIQQGKSGIDFITQIAEGEITSKIGGECREFNPGDFIDKKEARRMDRFTQFALAASRETMSSSNIQGNVDPERFGVVVGSGVGGIATINDQLRLCISKGFDRCSPFLVPMIISDIAAGRISIEYGAKGPNLCVVTACATGTDAIGEAFRMIQLDETDAVLAGGTEAPITPLSVAGFSTMRALSTRYDEPEKASRPFDKDRDGFVISEGSSLLMLEEYEHAKARGANILCEIIGYGRSSDSHDVVQPCGDGNGAGRAMANALRNAGIAPEQVGYINAHGTSTPLGDVAETVAIKRIFGDHATNGLAISSTKSMTGHLLGATGALEAIITIKSLQDQLLPPTINLDNPDPECDLDYIPHTARKVEGVDYAISNSFGFGGHNASLVFQRCPQG